MVGFLRFMALALGLAGWLVYLGIWIAVRAWGELVLTFGIWGPRWVEFFELWVEPAIIVSWVALIVWALHHELANPASKLSGSNNRSENAMSAD